jgi:integrase
MWQRAERGSGARVDGCARAAAGDVTVGQAGLNSRRRLKG